jgi:hypothetical protein
MRIIQDIAKKDTIRIHIEYKLCIGIIFSSEEVKLQFFETIRKLLNIKYFVKLKKGINIIHTEDLDIQPTVQYLTHISSKDPYWKLPGFKFYSPDKFKLKLETLDLFCPISKNAYEQSLEYLPYLLNTFKACIGCHCK